MQIQISQASILDIVADALIYSSNTRLAMTGGVGLALKEKFGEGLQTQLINASEGFGMELAALGDVIFTRSPPWQLLCHTICTDGSFIVDAAIITQVLKKSFTQCARNSHIRTIAISELGCGYGTFHSEEFFNLLRDVVAQHPMGAIARVVISRPNLGCI